MHIMDEIIYVYRHFISNLLRKYPFTIPIPIFTVKFCKIFVYSPFHDWGATGIPAPPIQTPMYASDWEHRVISSLLHNGQ